MLHRTKIFTEAMTSTCQSDVDIAVLNLVTRKNNCIPIVKLFLCDYKCRVHGKKCNSNKN